MACLYKDFSCVALQIRTFTLFLLGQFYKFVQFSRYTSLLSTVLPAISFKTVGSLSQRIRALPYLTDTVSTYAHPIFMGSPHFVIYITI
nr:MAG TPA: hypothetical protein [Caudoviricetes sp.]